MALAIGTNCGFVTTAPTADPAGTGTRTMDNYKRGINDVTPSTNQVVTEVGWWCAVASNAGTYEVGIYADSGGVPGARLYVSTGNAKGTTAGWKVVTGLNWELQANTTYWICVALTNTTTTTTIDYGTLTSYNYVYTSGASTLPDPFGSTSTSTNQTLAIYAVIEEATTYTIEGITYDVDGEVIGSCDCYLYKDNLDDTLTFVDHVTSNATTGAYQFTGIGDTDAQYMVLAIKDDTPHVFDVTDHVLQPAETPSVSYDLYLRSDADKGETSPDNDLRLRDADAKQPLLADVNFFGCNF